ncbi:MAG TPA: integrase family protein, partial [Planctomycetota bacterium]|nr:integrase family protein [Planctomycetota bacterium]
MKARLTARSVRELPAPAKGQAHYWDEEVAGLGLVVGKTARTFVLQHARRRITIGRLGAWTLELARKRARELVVALDSGRDPVAEGITLREAVEEHAARLRARGASPRTIAEFPPEVERLLPAWWSRPIAGITRLECRDRHREISERNGPVTANRVMRGFRAAYNAALKTRDGLPPVSPTAGVEWNKERRVQRPIPWADLPAWAAKVGKLGPVRRDFLLTALLTGLRSTDCATIRRGDVDLEKGALHRPNPKGGEERAFTVPIATRVVEILRARFEENQKLFPRTDLAFPCRNMKGRVVPVVARNVRTLPSPHRCRDTFISAACEAGVGFLEIQTLANHRPPSGSVTAGYVLFSLE